MVSRFLYKIVAHHSHVFMLQVVAMVQEQSRIIIKVHQDSYTFTWHEQNRIFLSFVHIPFMPDSAALNYPELLDMKVDGMGHVHHIHHPPTGVIEFPDLL